MNIYKNNQIDRCLEPQLGIDKQVDGQTPKWGYIQIDEQTLNQGYIDRWIDSQMGMNNQMDRLSYGDRQIDRQIDSQMGIDRQKDRL